jgi:lipid II:glycine glycyltransferase (peptidoglycan interpeptide bridge formation enzyme)
MENGGQIIAVLGIIFVIYDSISLDVSTATDYEWNVYNPFYLTRKWWQRVLSDLVLFYLCRVPSLWDIV